MTPRWPSGAISALGPEGRDDAAEHSVDALPLRGTLNGTGRPGLLAPFWERRAGTSARRVPATYAVAGSVARFTVTGAASLAGSTSRHSAASQFRWAVNEPGNTSASLIFRSNVHVPICPGM
ncbi:hypothetical protein EDD30_0389 [Couchioplanes caeruleus]|uniref:Uncharacterized protein n=1 Tax=Couchioplanes caeruleus TaxID=56438 RepID=A0A3N1GC37_9ACTN|nr:hypothetical protein EDD30_0389 [Couchioplanes caeruleus]